MECHDFLEGMVVAGSELSSTALNNGIIRMGDAAIALAILGFAVGVVFRLKILLSILGLLLVASIVFSLTRGYTFVDTALTITAVQCIVQASYFLGLVVRAVVFRTQRTPPLL
jgi:hypothetical protein